MYGVGQPIRHDAAGVRLYGAEEVHPLAVKARGDFYRIVGQLRDKPRRINGDQRAKQILMPQIADTSGRFCAASLLSEIAEYQQSQLIRSTLLVVVPLVVSAAASVAAFMFYQGK